MCQKIIEKIRKKTLTNLKDVRNGALLEQPQALTKRRVLVLERVGGAAARRRIHPYIALVPRKRPEHQPLLHRLRDARIPLLNPLERQRFGHKFGGYVEERCGGA